MKNAVNSQVGKMTISEDIRLLHSQASVFCTVGSGTSGAVAEEIKTMHRVNMDFHVLRQTQPLSLLNA